MYYTYVLLSAKDKKLYIGYSPDLKQRLKKHTTGKVDATRHRLPMKLIYYEAHLNQSDALRREKYFKTNKGKTTLKQMLHDSVRELRS